MTKKVAFRFDIDTLTCIKDGVPKLISLSEKYNVKFTFFMNFGKSVDRKEIFMKKNISSVRNINKLPTLTKLGLKNFILTVLINPKLGNYKNIIESLVASNNEIGLHGGLNHSAWQLHGSTFSLQRVEKEIAYGLKMAHKYHISMHGFTSPGMTSNKFLCQVLKANEFNYISDTYTFENETTENGKKEILKELKNINVNLVGKNGVGYFEYFLSKNLEPKKIIEKLMDEILYSDKDTFVIYDHPLIINLIEDQFETLIKQLKNNDIEFVTMNSFK